MEQQSTSKRGSIKSKNSINNLQSQHESQQNQEQNDMQSKLPNLQQDPVKLHLKQKNEQQNKVIKTLKQEMQRSPRIGNLKEMENKIETVKIQKGFMPRQRSAEGTKRDMQATQSHNINNKFGQTQTEQLQKETRYQTFYGTTATGGGKFITRNNFYSSPQPHKNGLNLNRHAKQNLNDIGTNINDLERLLSPSNKKNKTNKSQSSFFELLPPHLKEFYEKKQHFQKTFYDYDNTNYCLMEVNEKIKCYRYELGNLVDQLGNSYYKIVEQLLEATIKLYNDLKKKYDNQIKENLNMIAKLVADKKDLESSNRKLKSQNIVSESLYKITKINSDALQTEVIMLNDLLRKDVLSMVNHLSEVERQQQEQKEKLQSNNKQEDPSEQLITGLDNLNDIIDTMNTEQKSKDNFLGTMNGLLKAMLKGTKRDAFTQVDEGELIWNPKTVYQTGDDKLPFASDLNSIGINIHETKYNGIVQRNNIDAIKIKEKDQLNQQQQQKKGQQMNQQENWNLPVTLIVFLENVSKSNESGRVIPWVHFRKMLYDFYKSYIINSWEIKGGLVSSCVQMDEYLCMYMLKQYKLRRIAENKMFEFLVSLRYYCKNWSRAAMFALLCNITSFPSQPVMEHNFNFNFDIFMQHFFLYIFQKIYKDPTQIQETESQTFLNKNIAEQIAEEVMVFASETSKLKVPSKIQKLISKNSESDPPDMIDTDMFLDIFVEEYFEQRKKIVKSFLKGFSNIQQEESKLFSYESLKQITKDVLDARSPLEGHAYPRETILTRVFLYTLTSEKNKFEIQSKDFLNACARFGLDCPFPFIKLMYPGQDKYTENGILPEEPNDKRQNWGVNDKKEGVNPDGQNFQQGNQNFQEYQNQIKIDSSSSLFAQHFSILRELRNYVKNFKESYNKEEDQQILWQQFGNIINILDTGCQFLNFPINI